jgi:pimeloyl-ACP methyl ester carboxylesterase
MVKKIFFEKRGTGPAVILIHGFPMNHHVWSPVVPELEKEFTIYTPDLPGFGKSESLSESFSLEDVALSMNFWAFENELTDAVVIGHSLGGYVVLAMQNQKPEWYKGIGLLHSTSYEDSPEKKDSRTKVLKFIDDNGVLAFTSNFIEPLFADQTHPDISFVKSITVESYKDAVKAYTVAMRDRPDRRALISQATKPVLIVGGMEDKAIPAESLQDQAKLSPQVELHLLSGAAHMGMFEKKGEMTRILQGFLRSFVQ